MNTTRRARLMVLTAAILGLLLSTASAQQAGKKEFAFKGKVEKVDAKAKTITVHNEKIDGWMGAMTMTYAVDKPESLDKVKVGEEITAKVHEGDFKTLYGVQPAPAAAAAPKK